MPDRRAATKKVEEQLSKLHALAAELDKFSQANASVTPTMLRQWANTTRTATNAVESGLKSLLKKSLDDTADTTVAGGHMPHPPMSKKQSNMSLMTRAQKSELDIGTVGNLTGSFAPSNAQSPVAVRSTTLGSVVSGGLSLFLESVMVQTKAQRVCVYQASRHNGQLLLVAAAGKLGTAKLRTPVPSDKGLVALVYATHIAANLHSCFPDDYVDVKGVEPTSSTTLCFPLMSLEDHSRSIGVIQVSNKNNGPEIFTRGDETHLFLAARTVSYLLEQYPVDVAAHAVDMSPLHAVFPVKQFVVPYATMSAEDDGLPRLDTRRDRHAVPGVPEETSDLNAFLETLTRQLIFRTGNAGKYLRRNHLEEGAVSCELAGVARHLSETDQYIARLEDCWKDAVMVSLTHEQQESRRQQQVNDVRELLKRKQKKLQYLKDAIREEVMTNISQDVLVRELTERLTEYEAEENERRLRGHGKMLLKESKRAHHNHRHALGTSMSMSMSHSSPGPS
eukprot:PhM_4_TR5433/c0_g1_i1/m.71603